MTDIATTKDFQERMFERVRSQIGDLLTDDDLKRIVEAAMHRAFFEQQAHPRSYGNGVEYSDPVFVKLTRDLLKPLVTTAVQSWMRDNAALVQERVVVEIKASLPAIVLGIVKGAAEGQCMALVEAMKTQGLLR